MHGTRPIPFPRESEESTGGGRNRVFPRIGKSDLCDAVCQGYAFPHSRLESARPEGQLVLLIFRLESDWILQRIL